jgi:alkylhydroperoxidase family enzyme
VTPDDVRALAPEAFGAFDVVVATAAAVDAPTQDLGSFADQFVYDVAAITDEQRAQAAGALGNKLFDAVQSLYVADFGGRMRDAWLQLFDADFLPAAAAPAPSLWTALDAFFMTVARMAHVDAVTTELVRLRGARAHNCRLCKSLRSVPAASAGAGETTYDAIDRFETSSFPEPQKVALRLTDALLWEPRSYPATLPGQVRHAFSDAQAVELVFDVARNAANKIAVALVADAPHVDEGLESYEIDAEGRVVYLP